MANQIFKQRLIPLLVIIFLILFPHFVPLPFYTYAIVCLAVMIIYLKKNNQNLKDIGLIKSGLNSHSLLIGTISGLLWVAFNKWIYHPFIIKFFNVPEYTEYNFIRKNLQTFLGVVLAAWLIGGVYEELVFRGFIQTKMKEWFTKTGNKFWIPAIITSLLFGLYHWQQGIFGIIPSMLGGMLWSFLVWKYKGNLWYAIISHAVYDTVVLTMIYMGYSI